MARLLVQLKLRLLLNALRASTGAKVGFVVSTVFAVLVAIGAFVVLALLRGQGTSVDLTAVIFTVFALGCALIHNPSVLFLDEPLEGVDPVSADAIRRMLTNYVGSGSTVLFSSHVMELVEQVCDHVSVISEGRIVATGTTEQVRGGKTLQRAFIDLVGSKASEEGLSWLGSSSS